MINLKSLLTSVGIFLFSVPAYCQADGPKADMADLMRSNGRIYVVVAVVVLILAGLIIYLSRLDRKITKLEKENKH